jgi:hypothetical protein
MAMRRHDDADAAGQSLVALGCNRNVAGRRGIEGKTEERDER